MTEPAWTTALGAASPAGRIASLLRSTNSRLSRVLAGLGSLPLAVPPIGLGVGF
ncbi:MAG: hypothetical protein AAGI50_13705 [Pseudomonadota bacterium]